MSAREVAEFCIEYWYIVLVAFFVIWPFLQRISDLISGKPKRKAEETQLNRKAAELQKMAESISEREHTLLVRQSNLNDQVRDRTIDLARNIASREYLQRSPAFQALSQEDDTIYDRLRPALTSSMKISSPFDISATITSDSGEIYQTTLYSCSCPHFKFRNSPCKHMLRLALEVGLLFNFNTKSLENQINEMLLKRMSLQNEIADIHKKRVQFTRERAEFQKLVDETTQTYPWLSLLYADPQKTYDEKWLSYLRNKKRPAKETAKEVERIIKHELHEARSTAKQLEYQLHFYESLFPWLVDFKEVPPTDAFEYTSAAENFHKEDSEMLRKYISPEELSKPERYQLALDRYISKNKNNWEIGIEYERYIGYLCEKESYSVRFTGATMKLEDMGRDLIIEQASKTILIQCKRWSQEKTIHEKHIFQLAGSIFEYQYAHPDREVAGVFVTTTTLSPVAKNCAARLGIQVFENIPFCEYPRIKCNIGRDTYGNEHRIYHLPMDQQYDTVKIDAPGEFYANTVQEAEAAGFRRAYRWRGSKSE